MKKRRRDIDGGLARLCARGLPREHTLTEIGDACGCSAAYILKIQRRALRKMNFLLKRNLPEVEAVARELA